MTVGLAERPHLENWVSWPDAQSMLPELIRRLVIETTAGVADAYFPRGRGVVLRGFDGLVQGAPPGSMWVPEGSSVWEVSTQEDPADKAKKDFDKRADAPTGWDKSDTSYVAVSLRQWSGTDKWESQRTSRGWRSVRALGLDQLVSWLAVAPVTELWLADRLGLNADELAPGPVWWNDLLARTAGRYDETVVLSGRVEAAHELREQLTSGSSSVTVEAESLDDALEFIAAVAVSSADSVAGFTLLERTVFVDGSAAWRRLAGEPSGQLVLVAADPGVTSGRSASGNHIAVIAAARSGDEFAVPSASRRSRGVVCVPPLKASAVAEALSGGSDQRSGIEYHRAQDLGALGRRSPAALRRALSVDPVVQVPLWVRDEGSENQRSSIRAALLAGAWSTGLRTFDAEYSDREVIVELAGGDIDYETIERELHLLADGGDPLVHQSNSVWKLAAARDAWELFAPNRLTDTDIQRLLEAARRVLGETDPRRGMHGAEHATAGLVGIGMPFSQALRRGLARSLALLADAASRQTLRRCSDITTAAAFTVRRLLAGENGHVTESDAAQALAEGSVSTPGRLVDLADVLSLLAEAAPDEFLAAVKRSCEIAEDAAQILFTDRHDALDVMGPSSPHVRVLFALETLAWLPEHLARVADVLLRLQVLDPGGNTANRPSRSFAEIFSAWAPQTAASSQARLDILRALCSRVLGSDPAADAVAALTRMLLPLVPDQHSTVIDGPRPTVRDYELPSGDITVDSVTAYVNEVSTLLLDAVRCRLLRHHDGNAIHDLVDATTPASAARLPLPQRLALWDMFDEFLTSEGAPTIEPEHLLQIGRTTSQLARTHQQHADQDWSLPAAEAERLARLGELANAARPVDDSGGEDHLWLFEQHFPDLGDGPSAIDDHEAYEEALRVRRADAVAQIIRAGGRRGVERLADEIGPESGFGPVAGVGSAIAECRQSVDQTDATGLNASLADIEARLYRSLDLPEMSPTSLWEEQRDAAISDGYFGTSFRRLGQSDLDEWEWVRGLLDDPASSPTQAGRLLALTRDHPRSWQEASARGPQVQAAFWRYMDTRGLGGDFAHVEQVAAGLLSVDRHIDAAQFLVSYRNTSGLPPDRYAEFAMQALEGCASSAPARTPTHMDAWNFSHLLDGLAERCPLTRDNLHSPQQQQLARLQMAFIEARRVREPIPFLHDRLALDAGFYVEVMQAAYGIDADETQRGVAHRMLNTWRHPPGLDSDGEADNQILRTWLSEARRLLADTDIRELAEERIGRVLAALPPDPDDGISPPAAMRDLLEKQQPEAFEDGLVQGLASGPTPIQFGPVSQMASASAQKATRAESDTETIAARWPATAALLRRAALAHASAARRWRASPGQED